MKLGLVTIGQAPREDIVQSMFGHAVGSAIVEAGVLDGLDHSEIERLDPDGADHPLVTRLITGSEVVVGKRLLLPLLDRAAWRVEQEGAAVICVLCTGEFPTLESNALVVYPDRLLRGFIDALLPTGVLGVVMPHAGQREFMLERWSAPGRSVVIDVASPYCHGEDVATVAASLARSGARLILLDCMGFDRAMLRAARQATDVPIVLANGVVGGALAELIGVSDRVFDESQVAKPLDRVDRLQVGGAQP